MLKKISLFLVCFCLLSACGVNEDPTSDDNFIKVDEITPIETVEAPETTTKPPNGSRNSLLRSAYAENGHAVRPHPKLPKTYSFERLDAVSS
jgi:hypothetical protein